LFENLDEGLNTLHIIFKQDPDCAFESRISLWAVTKQSVDNIIQALIEAREQLRE
jgi:hypothetical protein